MDPLPAFHGSSDGGAAEWPPSPHRLFQAIVAGVSYRQPEFTDALRWLEQVSSPTIIAPATEQGLPYRIAVPNNDLDLVGRAWSKGQKPKKKPSELKTLKPIRPTRLIGDDAVYYLWPVAEGDKGFAEIRESLFASVRSITHLGWGVDMVMAEAFVTTEVDAEKLSGQRWRPTDNGSGSALRVPVCGTLDDLKRKYAAFLRRAGAASFAPVPPLSKFRIVGYANDALPAQVPFAAFELRKADGSGFRPFDPVRNGMRVAAMMRHAASDPALGAALGWSKEDIDRLVLGHGEKRGEKHVPVDGPRLAFVPLPSIESRGRGRSLVVGSVRRAFILGLRGASRKDLRQLSRLLSGQSLIAENTNQPTALLSHIPDSEKMVQNYTRSAATWATVTPVILPGYDDPKKIRRELFPPSDATSTALQPERQRQLLTKLDSRIDFLLRKAIQQAGFSAELARHAELDWSSSGYWPGTDLASRYATPTVLRRFRRLHVRVTWKDENGNALPISGPLCLGGGRFIGMGLFAALPNL